MHLQLRRPSEACNTRVLGQVSTEAKTSGEWVFKWCFTHVLSLTSNYYGKFCICLIDFFKSPVLLIFSFWMNFLKLTIFLHIWSNLPNFSFLLSFFSLDTYMLFHCQLLLKAEFSWASSLLLSRSFYSFTYPSVSCLYLYKEVISKSALGEYDSSVWWSLVPHPSLKAMAWLFFLRFYNIIWQTSIRFILLSHN